MTDSQPEAGPAIEDFDQARSDQYRFLARLLAAAPDAAALDHMAQLRGDDSVLGLAFANLARSAQAADAKKVEREFFELFVGVGRGELLPYASFYQTGFLNERPLADLRGDLAALGVARAEGRHEPEDHIALLFEVMADFASGEITADEQTQARFFARHLQPWALQFFDDLAVAPSVAFYRPVAEIGRILTEIETRAFALAA
jgi:TorA maturation chaperone TorD